MGILLTLVGAALLLGVTYDALHTTLAPTSGAGPMTRRVAGLTWRLVARAAGGPRSRLLAGAGPLALITTVGSWLLLLWAGWALLYGAGAPAIRASPSGAPVDAWDIVYFAGFAVFSLGVGDFVPTSPLWQVLTPVATLHGLFLLTLAITYLLPVVQAAVERQQQAAQLWGMGGSAVRIVAGAWHRGSYETLERDLQLLTSSLLLTVERHPAYPVLNYFHTPEPRSSFPPRVAALDDAVTLLLEVVSPDVRPNPTTLMSLRRAVDDLLDTPGLRPGGDDVPVPPLPDLAALAAASLPLVDARDAAGALDAAAPRRQRLHAYVLAGGWSWDDVVAGPRGRGGD